MICNVDGWEPFQVDLLSDIECMTNIRNVIPTFYNYTSRLYEHKALHKSVNSRTKTIITFSILVIALGPLFGSDPVLGNQQALAAVGGAGGGGGGFGGGGGGAAGGGSFAASGGGGGGFNKNF